jgi:hypothetical protein
MDISLNLHFGFGIEWDLCQQCYVASMAISSRGFVYYKEIPVAEEDSSEYVMAHMLDSFKLNTYKSWSNMKSSNEIKFRDYDD